MKMKSLKKLGKVRK